jgi:beta-galactosidase
VYGGHSTELAIEAQMCAAFNRHIMHDGSLWAAPSAARYASAPTNGYAKSWHDHSESGLAYGFC